MIECLHLFITFFKIGLFTFGGGYAMLPLIQQEVLANGWMDIDQLVNFVAIAESTPGPFAINMATFVGVTHYGFFGAVCATLGVVAPSFIVILIVAQCFEKFKTNKIVAGAMTGLRPTSVGLIAAATVSIGLEVLFPAGFSFGAFLSYEFIAAFVIFACMLFVCLKFKKFNPIYVILITAVLGIAVGYGGELLGVSII